jgi:hypothetical protein
MAAFTGPNTVNPDTICIFTTSGSFTPQFSGTVEVLAVAGGGGGGSDMGGGGGGGGVISNATYTVTSGVPITVTVGAGGNGAPAGTGGHATTKGTNGGNSSLGVNLISDGTFSLGIAGWSTYNSSIALIGDRLRSTSTSGNPAGVIYYFNTVVGQTYYYKADVSQSGAVSNDARIQISGIGLINSTGQSTVSDTRTVFDSFTATSTTHILEILLNNYFKT